MTTVMEETGQYIYCVAEGDRKGPFASAGIGNGRPVRILERAGLCAAVSPSPVISYRLDRENTLCHQRVVEEVMASGPVLPVRFGTIARNEANVLQILEMRHEEFAAGFDRVRECHELGVKVTWRKEAVFAEILRECPEIAREREALLSAGISQGRDHWRLVAVGERIQAALRAKNELERNELLQGLEGLAREVRVNDAFSDRMVLNTAFLVEHDKEPMFDAAVQRLTRGREERMAFKYVGPVPPANFVEIVISLDELDGS